MVNITIKNLSKIIPDNVKINVVDHKKWGCSKQKFPQWKNGFKTFLKNDAYNKKNKYVLKTNIDKFENLNIKKFKSGKCIFALSKNVINIIMKNKKDEKNEENTDKKRILTEAFKNNLELQKEFIDTQNEIRQILEENPGLVKYYNSLKEE